MVENMMKAGGDALKSHLIPEIIHVIHAMNTYLVASTLHLRII
jgi:hypothetical protein